ncbi:ABC transporter permease [Blastococcus sp. BMG 814]|uniref:ABC transporter permease n=1 Tax=Blastococcus carthaginiensis TaxID=3050034 RepID=A0ABT9IEL2_9ACTN|nr:ABC transporter permease [Blastococcus carthaginiensis]MDP5183627.1 ABC transporter permease [Blastococcus carthaginiensis]
MSSTIATWLGRRVLGALVTVVIASVVVFGALRLMPDTDGALAGGRRLTPEQMAALRERYGLDDPFLMAYADWAGNVLSFDFGISTVYQDSVNTLLASRLPVSAFLIGYSVVLTVLLGLTVAVIGAVKGGVVARLTTVLTSGAAATPPFVATVVLLSVFAVQLGWFPTTGAGEGFLDRLWHLTLPALAMALVAFGVLARVAQATFVEELRREHVEVARSRGVRTGAIVRRHVIRNALGPIMTLGGVLVAGLFVGTAVVETAFGVNGIGSFLVSSVARQDFPVVQALALIGVTLFVVVSTIVEVLLPVVDPRVRKELVSR